MVITKINKISAATKNAIVRKSAQTLPDRPSEMKIGASEIKRRLVQFVTDSANSALAEIDRLVGETNISLSEVESFIQSAEIDVPYKQELNSNNWVFAEERNRYEVTVTKAMHGIEDYKEILITMFLIGTDGKLVSVNNFELFSSGTVRFYNENQGGGFFTISRNRNGFIKGVTSNVSDIIGIAEVAKTNDYNDLDNLPDIDDAVNNQLMIAKIINGEQAVGNANAAVSAQNAVNAQNALYATNAGYAQSAPFIIPTISVNDSGAISKSLLPNNLYIFTNSSITSLEITLGEVTEGRANEYMFQFKATAANMLSVPSSVVWANEFDITALEVGWTYQVSIVNNIGVIVGVQL